MKKHKKKLTNIAICCILALCLAFCITPKITNADNGHRAGDWIMSDEKIEDAGYRFELTYRLMEEEIKYIYLTPQGSSTLTTRASKIGEYMSGNYYTAIQCDGLKVSISSGTCFVSISKGGNSFVTTQFSLKELW